MLAFLAKVGGELTRQIVIILLCAFFRFHYLRYPMVYHFLEGGKTARGNCENQTEGFSLLWGERPKLDLSWHCLTFVDIRLTFFGDRWKVPGQLGGALGIRMVF